MNLRDFLINPCQSLSEDSYQDLLFEMAQLILVLQDRVELLEAKIGTNNPPLTPTETTVESVESTMQTYDSKYYFLLHQHEGKTILELSRLFPSKLTDSPIIDRHRAPALLGDYPDEEQARLALYQYAADNNFELDEIKNLPKYTIQYRVIRQVRSQDLWPHTAR
ncbi:MAG: hypothetical protein QG599_1191 [Pseudomonadota bacterium]|nr:hypothetical protein [Pseudomonadota bacterium]